MVAKINLDDMFNQGLFQHPISLGDSLEEVRNNIINFNLDSQGIDILSFQAGVGKTYHTNELLKNKDSYLLVTGSHKLIEEEYEGLKAKHWEKFSLKCVKYTEQVKRLDSLGVSKRFICDNQGCDKRKCPYWKQFNTKKAKAPFHYLTSDRVLDQDGDFKFDMLVVDEAMDYGTEYALDEDSLDESIQAMGNYEDVKFLEEIDWNNDLFDYVKEKFNPLNSKRYGALNGAINEKKWDDVEDIAKFRPYNLIRYYYYHHIYGNSSSYHEPLLYNVFDLVRQEVPIIMLDASFDIKTYEIILGRYNFEHKLMPRDLFINQALGPLTDLQTMVYSSNLQEKHKTIYRMDKNNYYYKTGLLKNGKITENGEKTVKELESFIKRTKRKYINIGLITHQALEPYFSIETEHFFNLRGSNKFKDVDVLFIVGTPQKPVQAILGGYNKLCLTEFTLEDIYKPVYELNDGKNCIHHKYKDLLDNEYDFWDCNNGRGYEEKKPSSYMIKGDYESEHPEKIAEQGVEGEIDLELWYEFSEYSFNQDESEKYQAIHRARPFINDNPIIYVFGDIPEKIKEEFNVVSYDKGSTRIHFGVSGSDTKGVYPLVLFYAVMGNFTKTRKSEEIAKSLKLYKKDKKGYNSKFITTILKGININDVQRIDEYLKEDINVTPNQIKRKFRNLNIDEEMIEYFIFYTKEGSFINV